MARKDGETPDEKAARFRAVIASRVPDIQFLLTQLLNGAVWGSEAQVNPDEIGIVGHSFGGWTALAINEIDQRVRAVVALAPGGASNPRPGVLPAKLTFDWGRDVPTLYLVAENDVSLPLAGMYEIFDRTQTTKQMVILRRADHMHFMDCVEEMHETVRNTQWPAELAWIQREMRPIKELCSGEQAQLFVRGLALCHMDAVLKRQEPAQRLLAGDVEQELRERGVEVIAHKS
jgi:predicted dienelactone hydrolase